DEHKPGIEPEFQNDDGSETEPESYFINNAGIILLNAALMQQYLESFGWLKNKKIVDDTSLSKIILWIDHLVYGERKLYEYDLILNKVLAGIHPVAVCDIGIQLSPLEKSAADEYLQTVISYWSA